MTPNPFNPSAANPRYLAGREAEKAALADVLEAGRQSPVAVIYAPRGNGKTALAHWLERAAIAKGMDARYRYARSCQDRQASRPCSWTRPSPMEKTPTGRWRRPRRSTAERRAWSR